MLMRVPDPEIWHLLWSPIHVDVLRCQWYVWICGHCADRDPNSAPCYEDTIDTNK
jgi:hypothetical protein